MSKKKNMLAMLEAHADKMIVGVIGVIGLYLLWTLVISNPYAETIQGRRVGPGQIDVHNQRQARSIQEALNRPAESLAYDLRVADEFEQLLQTPLTHLAANLGFPYPGVGTEVFDDDRVYPVPEIVPLTDVKVAHVRGAAHRPTETIGPDSPYRSVQTELADLDFVTIDGRIDLETLYRNFQQSFVGPRLSAAWREPAFAQPVFARVQLQRRRQHGDGAWGPWQTLSGYRLDPFRRLLGQTPMTTDEMEMGDVMMWRRQYEDMRVQANLLQPVPYDFASLRTGWLPPRYMDEAQDMLQRDEEQRRRQEREQRLAARGTDDQRDTRRTAPTQTRRRQTPQMQEPMRSPTTPQRTDRRREERTLDDIRQDWENARIDEQTQLDRLREPLLVWAHDDTVQPGQRYQYRMRFGVFNPIAGRNWFRDDQRQFKNQIVLWSDFSEPTAQVSIPRMQHLFPLETLSADAETGLKIDVARYYMGQWRTQEFEVFPGQMIGDKVEQYTPPEAPAVRPRPTAMLGEMDMWSQGGSYRDSGSHVELSVDFATPYLLVDVDSRSVWQGTRSSELSKMLYHGPEDRLLTMAVGSRNWPSEVSQNYRDIKDAEQDAVPLDRSRRSRPGEMMPREMDGMMDMDMMMFDDMMY